MEIINRLRTINYRLWKTPAFCRPPLRLHPPSGCASGSQPRELRGRNRANMGRWICRIGWIIHFCLQSANGNNKGESRDTHIDYTLQYSVRVLYRLHHTYYVQYTCTQVNTYTSSEARRLARVPAAGCGPRLTGRANGRLHVSAQRLRHVSTTASCRNVT